MKLKPLHIAALAALPVLLYGAYSFTHRLTPNAATGLLTAQNIDVNEVGLINEAKAGHTENVHYFLVLGATPGTADRKNNTTALLAAIEGGHADTIDLLLKSLPASAVDALAMLNQGDASGTTPLLAATERGDVGVIDQIVAHGADVAQTNHQAETALIVAAKHHFNDLAAHLIAIDAQQHGNTTFTVGSQDKNGNTPLLIAIKQQNPDLVKTLIAAKADTVSADLEGITPLMAVADIGNQPIATLLIQSGARLNVADHQGNSPLSIALKAGHPDFVKFLVAQGADPEFHTGSAPSPLEIVSVTKPFDSAMYNYLLARSKKIDPRSSPLLFDAIADKNPDLVKTLLANGLSPNGVNANGETVLYKAMESGVEPIALAVMDKGADVTKTGVTGVNPLEVAVKENEPLVVARLLDEGVPPDQKTPEGYTLAEMAVYRGYPGVLDALMAKGARIQKEFGLLWSIRDGHGKAVPVLLKYGANPNVMSDNGDPALWLAASTGEIEAVQALIAHRAAIDYPNRTQGTSPLAIAAHMGELEVVKLLVNAGAKLEHADRFGMTPLAHAAYMTKPDVVDYLVSNGADTQATDKQKRTVRDLASLSPGSVARDKVLTLLQER